MKTYKPVLIDSVTASTTIARFRFVSFSGGICGAGEKALGVSDADTTQGQSCPVIVLGIALVEASGAISQGALVYSDDSGKATATGTSNPNGRALDAASGAGDIIRILLS